MKKIYKLGFIALFSVLGINASAQSPITWGVKAGVNLSNASIKDYQGDSKAKVGFQVGVTAEYAITNDFYLQSGLSFTTKGSKGEWTETVLNTTAKAETTINQMYLQLPIMAAYKLEVVPGTKIVFNAGPYLAYGLGGKSKTKWSTNSSIVDLDYENEEYDTFDDGNLKKFDFGLGAGVGVEFGQIVVGLNYELGLTNIADNKDSDYKDASYKNRNASLTVGYRF